MRGRTLVFCGLALFAAGCGSVSAASSHSTTRSTAVPELKGLGQLRSVFNDHSGEPRLIVLASPTCPTCVVGTSWIRQHVLEAHPHARLSVIVVWEPMYPGDSYSAIDPKLFSDRRAINFWDPHEMSGHFFGMFPGGGTIAWDRYYAYSANAQWTDDSADAEWTASLTGLIVSGHPIIGGTDGLERSFLPRLD